MPTSKVPDCAACGQACCRYVATEIDRPTCKRDYDNIRWYLRHANVFVFRDHDGKWYLEFETRCEALGEDGFCTAYETRPKICREHGHAAEGCEFHSGHPPHDVRFETAEAFERWLDARGVDWRWARL
ncbi:MAG: YkgJ family cysteine cluster protein [Lentisphaerae bacterium]|nr:YkgJ family cysteine cluster protein [Lentisphaerota bacterium]